MSSSGYDTVIMKSQELLLPALGLHKATPASSQPWMWEELTEPHLSMLNSWLLKDTRGRKISVFSCVPIGEPTKLHWIVPDPRSLRRPYLNSGVHERKKDMSIRKRAPGRNVDHSGRKTRKGRGESNQNVHC